jgi:hypothetical protein
MESIFRRIMSEILNDIRQGDTVALPITVKLNGVAVNITGWHLYFSAKKNLNDTEFAISTKEITEHSDPTHGITAIPLTADDTSDLEGTYHYDIRYKKPDGSTGTGISNLIVIEKTPTPPIS